MSDAQVDLEDVHDKQNEQKAKPGCCGKQKKKKGDEPEVPSVPFTKILATAPNSYWMMFLGALCTCIHFAVAWAWFITVGFVFLQYR